MSRSRITITIKEELLKQLDSFIDGVNIKNRSHAIELFLSEKFPSSGINKAVILAGGEGIEIEKKVKTSRILGQYKNKKIIDYILIWLKAQGISEVIISAAEFSSDVKRYLGDGNKIGIQISYLFKDKGTADTLKYLDNILDEPFLMMNGDVLSDINLGKMFDFHNSCDSVCTIAVASTKEPHSYGNIVLDGNKIVDFIEKPEIGKEESYLISSGIYIMNPSIFDLNYSNFNSLERNLFPFLAKEGKLCGYYFKERWLRISNKNKK